MASSKCRPKSTEKASSKVVSLKNKNTRKHLRLKFKPYNKLAHTAFPYRMSTIEEFKGGGVKKKLSTSSPPTQLLSMGQKPLSKYTAKEM